MRNYRELTPHEVERLKDEYPITANRHLSARYGISIDGINKLAKNLGWKKDRSSVCTGSSGGHTPTAEEEAWVVEHFPNTPNAEIMQRIDIAESTLYRIARRYGLKKEKRYLSRMRRANLKEASRKCKELGVYKENAERAKAMWEKTKMRPREEWPGYKPGLKPWQQPGMTRRKYVRGRQKTEENMKHQRKMEWFRIMSGEKQQTRLRLRTNITRRASIHKYMMIKDCNYFAIDGEVLLLCYDEQTRRSMKREATARRLGLKVEAAEGYETEQND